MSIVPRVFPGCYKLNRRLILRAIALVPAMQIRAMPSAPPEKPNYIEDLHTYVDTLQ